MTRKDYKLLAGALKSERPGENWDANKRVQWNQDVKAIARVLASDNVRSNHGVFIAACGGLFGV
jgi:hypothetical protein